jgi:hypothetical protein
MLGVLASLPVRISKQRIEDVAQFSFVRVARSMPTLRPFRPDIMRSDSSFLVKLPTADCRGDKRRAVVFDGGIPDSVDLSRWVKLIDADGVGPASRDFQEHGLAVTSALLFGPLDRTSPAERPLCPMDHVRVLDVGTTGDDLQYPDVLDRICNFLAQHIDEYQFVNISLGPSMPIDDDDITQWTARLDQIFASGKALVTIAAGNDGELDAEAQLNRVQPPADAVNVLAVGSCDTRGEKWKRASYSCIGPGRTPGLVKPDGVIFGGSDSEPFMALSPGTAPRARGVMGTSFAAPNALRSGIAVGIQLGDALSPLAIRTLLVHHAHKRKSVKRHEVGWGRFLTDPSLLVTCEDNESVVIYEGQLPVGQHLSAQIPLPANLPEGEVQITATLVISPEINPEHAGAYTRSGVIVTFRPDAADIAEDEHGRKAQRARSDDFFSLRKLYSAGEYVLREDGHKWEPCIRATRQKHSSTLRDPHFDIKYHHRDGPQKAISPKPIPYCLIVTLKAPEVPDLYNRVVRAYSSILVPLRPQLRIPVRS